MTPIHTDYREVSDAPANADAEERRLLGLYASRRKAKHAAAAALDRALSSAARAAATPTTLRLDGFRDVITVEPNQHGIGWTGYSCEFSSARTTFRCHTTLVEFARQHFGHGILRKIDANRYAVLANVQPSVWGDVFDRPKAA